MNKLKKFFLVNSFTIILLSVTSCNKKKEISNNIFQYYSNNTPQYIIFQEKKQLYPNIPIIILGYDDQLKIKEQDGIFLCKEIQINKSNHDFDSLVISYNTKGLEGTGVKQFDAKVLKDNLIFNDVENKKSGLIRMNTIDKKWVSDVLFTISSDKRLIKKNISLSENENSFSIIYYKNKKKYFVVGNQINHDANIKLLLILINTIINSNENNYTKKENIYYESLDSLNNYIKKYNIGIERIPAPVVPWWRLCKAW